MAANITFRELEPDEWETWDRFCMDRATATAFHTTIWLGERSEGRLNILGAFRGDNLVGGFPHLVNRRLGLSRIVKPRLTPYYGPVWDPAMTPDESGRLIEDLVHRLRHHDALSFSLLPAAAIPGFKVGGLQPVTSYPGSLPAADIQKSLRTCLKFPDDTPDYGKRLMQYLRSARKAGVASGETNDPEVIYEMSEITFRKSGRNHPFQKKEFLKLYERMSARQMLTAFKAELHGAGVIGAQALVCDPFRAYNILSGIRWEYSELRAGHLLMAHCIEWAVGRGLMFDFEGSSIEPIFKFFSKFRPDVVHYPFNVHVNSRRIRLLNAITSLAGRPLY